MKKVVTPSQMGSADAAAVTQGIPSLELMERAGYAVSRAAIAMAGGVYGKRFVVICGKGNNAGDGFVAARHLKDAGAFPVVVLAEDASEIRGDARVNLDALRGVRVLRFDAIPDVEKGEDPGRIAAALSHDSAVTKQLSKASVIIDALFGTGFRGEMSGVARSLTFLINHSPAPVLAVDIPSGVDGETGELSENGGAVVADLTITMAALKRGLVEYPGSEQAGSIVIADIGIPDDLIQSDVGLVEADDVRGFLPARRPRTSHKRSVGSVLVVAGSVGMSGAAALTASAALRSGAGYVTVAAPSSVALELDQSVLEATTLPLPETARGTIEGSAVDMVLERAQGFDVVAIGPGLSTDEETVAFIKKVIAELDKPLVMDADAINAFQGDAGALVHRRAPTLLTPHPGELARLMGSSSKKISSDRVAAAQEAAQTTAAVVLLKGYRTVIASPPHLLDLAATPARSQKSDGIRHPLAPEGTSRGVGPPSEVSALRSRASVVICPTGGPALATAGTGDVLTGVASALLAESGDPFSSAWAAAWVHGTAGDLLAERLTDRSLKAGDMIDVIPEVFADLLK